MVVLVDPCQQRLDVVEAKPKNSRQTGLSVTAEEQIDRVKALKTSAPCKIIPSPSLLSSLERSSRSLAYSCGPGRGLRWLLSALLFSSSLSLLPSMADYLARMEVMNV
jgi:hypothetical protein